MAIKAMDAIVASRVIQDFIYFPVIVLLAIRTDNFKHSPFSYYSKFRQRSTFSQGNLRTLRDISMGIGVTLKAMTLG